ncbi:MAG: TfoX/Sxy family protein [Proteobacteria bacterium]|nr:TfoX/Sxy family protein [Pseudomonadota bacterium]
MAYSEALAARIRAALASRRDVAEKKMFGGVAFMVRGHMCVGVNDDELMVRVGAEQYEVLVARPHTRPMDFTGRPLKGFLYVAPAGVRTAATLKTWLGHGLRHAEALPAKKAKAKKKA